jgi:hypothetical protein
MRMTYYVFHCSDTIQLVSDSVATPPRAAHLLLRHITTDITCSSVVTPISCLRCRKQTTAPHMLQYYIHIVTGLATEDFVRIVNWFIQQPTSRNYNYYYNVTGLHTLQTLLTNLFICPQ